MKKRGFTLIEIIVSTAIFTIVVTISIGALTSLNKTAREARAVRIIMDNANSAVDSISRTVRMGVRFDGACDVGCACADSPTSATVRDTSLLNRDNPLSSGNTCLKFYGPRTTTQTLGDIRYRYNGVDKRVERSQDGGVSFESMTAPEVEVSDMRFYVTGSGLDKNQPMITMIMSGVAKSSNVARDFTVQTSVTPRTPNLSIIEI